MGPNEVICLRDDFLGALTLTTTPQREMGWTVKDSSSGGTPTYTTVDGAATGELALTLDNTNEAQIVTLYQNNILAVGIDNIQSARFRAKVAGIDAVTTLVFGLAGDQHDTPDSVAQNAWFRMEGSASLTAVVVETDDGTTDNNDKATSQSLASTYKDFLIDFSQGKSDVRFYMSDANGHLTRVAESTTFDMSAYSGSLQVFAQLQKASGTGVPAVTFDLVEINLKRAG